MTRPEITYIEGRPCVSGANLKKHPLYPVWRGLRQRCNCPTHKDYHNYGGRGISVCKRWDNPNGDSTYEGFINFCNDMGPRPIGKYPSGATKYSIDRINNDGDYEPGNCRWVTLAENDNNRRYPVWLKGRICYWRYGEHPYRYVSRTGKWRVAIPNGDGTFFRKSGLTKEEADELVKEKGFASLV